MNLLKFFRSEPEPDYSDVRQAIPLHDAVSCHNCSTIWEWGKPYTCPSCGSRHGKHLASWLNREKAG